jgi:hypothetical protein
MKHWFVLLAATAAIKREVRASPECKSMTVQETAPDGSSRSVTKKKCG